MRYYSSDYVHVRRPTYYIHPHRGDPNPKIVRVLGELPVGPQSKARLLPLLLNLRKIRVVSLTLRRPRRESPTTGLTLRLAARGKAWTPIDESSPLAAGCLIEAITEGTPASREEASGRLFMSDIVASMHQVSFVTIGKAKMGEQNTFKGHEQTLSLKVWRTSGANA